MEEIPHISLSTEIMPTALKYVPVGSCTKAKEGSKQVPIAGVDDKRQVTAVFRGYLLPPQLIYKSISPKCLPEIRFPEELDITYTENHWSKEETSIQYIHYYHLTFFYSQAENGKEVTTRSMGTMYL